MTLDIKLLNETFEKISNTKLSLLFMLFNNSEKEVLQKALDSDVINEDNIECAIKDSVILEARNAYDLMTYEYGYTIYADHILRPDALSYAIENNEFKKEELSKIPFDHGDTYETYTNNYGKKNLLKDLKKELLLLKDTSFTNSNYFSEDYDTHFDCDCN